jgi:hypothetical protein
MRRIDDSIEKAERTAAEAINKFASHLEDSCYLCPAALPATQKAVLRAFRVARQVLIFYHGDDHGLVYEPPDFRFKPKRKGTGNG